jgi:drug/metabolite transporter (DMT)-like permease
MKMTTKDEIEGYILVLVATIFYGTAGVLGRMVFQYESEPLTVTTFQTSIAACLMFFGFLIFHRDLLKIKKRDIRIFALYGFIGITCESFCFYSAIKYTTVATAVILLFTYPALVVIFSAIIFREPLTRRKLISLLLSFVGASLVIQCYNLQLLRLNLLGILFGVGLSFCTAAYTLFGKRTIVDYDSWTVVFYSEVFGTLFLILFRTPQVLLQVRYPLQGWLWLFLNAFIPTTLGNVCYIRSLHHLEAGKASIIAIFEIVVASVLAFIFLHEGLEFLQIVGAGLVIWGVLILRRQEETIKESTASSPHILEKD